VTGGVLHGGHVPPDQSLAGSTPRPTVSHCSSVEASPSRLPSCQNRASAC
jgi:hypothetical protein